LASFGTSQTGAGQLCVYGLNPPQRYMVGDVAPFTGSSAGSFGDGALNTLDLLTLLRAVAKIPGYVVPSCSDLFDAMDIYPPDAPGVRGGDGALDTLDLIQQLRRITGIDSSRPMRTTRETPCTSAQPQAIRSPESSVTGLVEIDDGTVYVKAYRDVVLGGLALSVGAVDGGALQWIDGDGVAGDGIASSLVDSGIPGVLAVAWLDSMTLPAGKRVLLGRVMGSSQLRVVGVTANEGLSGRAVRFIGAPRRGS
jgi:hypothetical protein